RARIRLPGLGKSPPPALVRPYNRIGGRRLTLYSWDKRIRRAEHLADDYPASAEVLRFYAQVARFQQGVYERLKREAAGATGPEALEPDFPRLLGLIQRIGPAPLAGKAGEFKRENRSFQDLLGINDPEVRFFVRVLLQPMMECAPGCNGSIAEDG